MLCQKCGQKNATVFITQTVNNKTTQIHLCEECAAEQAALGGMSPFSVALDPSSMLKDFFSTLFPGFEEAVQAGGPQAPSGRVPPGDPALQCPSCGFQFPLFQQTGRLGCPQCYRSFAPLLDQVIASVHGKAAHVEEGPPAPSGESSLEASMVEVPAAAPATANEDPALADLRARLKTAVAREDFEEAARLRDEIRKAKG
jgi:protein arginine kinase activator